MRAMVIREFGPPDVMKMEDVPDPVPQDSEVLIEVHAVSVNRTLDLAVRGGTYARPVTLPHVLGADPSGIIVAVGANVIDRRIGDRVATSPLVKPATATSGPLMLGVQAWGGYAQYVTVPVAATHLIPDGIDFPTATVVARHAPIAFNMLCEKARLQVGQWVLVMGAAGGLGSAGVQVAKYRGGRVIAAAGSDERVAAAVALGADAGVNYRSEDLTKRVMAITGGRGADVVFENIGDPDLFPKAFASLARNGRLVTAGGHAGVTVPLDIHRLYLNYLTIIGTTQQTADDVTLALRACAEGRYKALIDRIMPLSQAAEAHRLTQARQGIGKIVLDPRH